MADADAKIVIGGDTSQLQQELQKSQKEVQSSLEKMQQDFNKFGSDVQSRMLAVQKQMQEAAEHIRSAFETIERGMVAITAITVGSGAIRKFSEDAIEVTKSAVAMGRALGISATEASYLKVALASAGVTSEDYQTAANKISRTLATNEGAFENLGVATRDANGNLRSTREILDDTNAKLREFQEGTDRNVEGITIYGKAWAEIAPLVAKFKGESEETRQEAEALNLVVGAESVAALAAYRKAHIGASEVMEGISNTIGQALLPRFTELANWFRSIGPQAVESTRIAMAGYMAIQDEVTQSVGALWDSVRSAFREIAQTINSVFGSAGEGVTAMEFFKNVLKAVQVAFIGFRVAIQEVASAFDNVFSALMIRARQAADVISAALRGDWAGVKAAWDKGGADLEATQQKWIDNAVRIATKGRADIDAALMGDLGGRKTVTATAKPKEGLRSAEGDGSKSKADTSYVSHWEQQLREWELLQQEKAQAEGRFFEISARLEADFWKSALTQTKTGTAENLAVRAKITELEKKLIEERYQAELSALKGGEQAAKNNLEAKLAYAQAELEIVKQKYGEESKAAIDASVHVAEIQRAQVAQVRELADLKANAARETALASVATEERSAKASYDARQMTLQQLLALEQSFEDRRNAIRQNAAQQALANIDPQMDPVAYQKTLNEIEKLREQHEARMQEITIQGAKAQEHPWLQTMSSISASFDSLARQFAKGTMSIKTLFLDMSQAILSGVVDTFVKIGVKRAEDEVLQLAGLGIQKTETVGAAAVEAGASGIASMAAAPFPANLGALAFGASLFEGVKSYASASGGFDIPAGLNPLTQLHAREMVLPASIADPLRQSLQGGGVGGGGDQHIHIHATDADSFKRLINSNRDAFLQMMRTAGRNFAY